MQSHNPTALANPETAVLSQYGQYLDTLIADLKANGIVRNLQIDIWVSR
jgi:hypothetical protein